MGSTSSGTSSGRGGGQVLPVQLSKLDEVIEQLFRIMRPSAVVELRNPLERLLQ